MTPEEEKNEEVFAKLLAVATDPEVVRCVAGIRRIANYDVPKKRSTVFLRFHAFITNPVPKYISAWRKETQTEQKWYVPHVDGVLTDVRGALAATHYHAANLIEIEAAIDELLAQGSFQERMAQGMCVGVGGTRRMDIEYQAFVLAYRRCLDYLTKAFFSYFELDTYYYFSRLSEDLAKAKPKGVATALRKAHSRHVDALSFVLAPGLKSVRNQIAHCDFVSAGCINLTPKGFFLAGGGEKLRESDRDSSVNLKEALTNRLDRLYACLEDMIDTFIDAARKHEQPPA